MKKKSIFVGGALLLTAAFGISALAGSGLVNLPFAAVTTAEGDTPATIVGTLAPTSSYPVAGANLPSDPAVSMAYLLFNTGDAATSLNRECTGSVVIKKDGAEVASFNANSEALFVSMKKDGGSYNNVLGVNYNFSEAGEYEVSFPEAIAFVPGIGAGASGDGSGEGETPEDAYTKAYTIKFKVFASLSATPGYPTGSKLSRTEIAKFTITYPEGTKITFNEITADGKQVLPAVAHWNGTYVNGDGEAEPKWFTLSEYNVAVEENVIHLTAIDPSGIMPGVSNSQQYDGVIIPEGLFTIENGDIKFTNTETIFSPYTIIAIGDGDFTFEPALDTPGLTVADLDELKMTVSDNLTCAVTKPAIQLYAEPYLYNATYSYTFKEVSADGKTYTFTRTQSTSATAAANNAAIAQAGKYGVRINANQWKTVVDGKDVKNTQLNIPAWTLQGLEYNPIYNSSPANGACASGNKIGTFSVSLLRPAVIAEGKENELIKVYYGNVPFPIAQFTVGSTTTKTATTTGSASIAYAKIQNDGVDFTDPGAYRYVIPAGVYKQVGSDWVNQAHEVNVYIPGNMDYELSPVSGVWDAEKNELVCESSFTELSELRITFPKATKLELSANYKNVLMNSQIGNINATNISKDAPSINTVTSAPTFTDCEIDGNVLIVKTTAPYAIATPPNRYFGFKLNQGLVLVTEGAGYNQTILPSPAIYGKYNPLPVQKGYLANYLTLDKFQDAVTTTDFATIVYHQNVQCWPNQEDLDLCTAVLKNSEGTIVANYVGRVPATKEAEREEFPINKQNLVFETEDDLAALPSGKYTFEIGIGAIQVGSETSASLIVYNTEAFAYDIDLVKPATEPTFPTALTVSSNAGEEKFKFAVEDNVPTLTATLGVTDEDQKEIQITVDVPEGWASIYHFVQPAEDPGVEPLQYANALAEGDDVVDPAPVVELEWATFDEVEQMGLSKGNVLTIPSSTGEYMAVMLLATEDKVCAFPQIMVVANVSNNTAVEAIDAAADNAEYYTLQGVKVANPEPGFYIQVLNGKAIKVRVNK